MEIYCGTDIIEIDRIQDSIESLGDIFKTKIYTQQEIEYCESKKNARYQHYAARFAAKEAIFKAICPYLKDKYEISWKNAEIYHDAQQRPKIRWIGVDFSNIHIDLSISHCKKYAVATVIATKMEN